MKKVLLAGAVVVVLFMLTPFLVLILVAGTSANVAACQQWANGLPLAGPSSSQVTLTQANIKVSLPNAAYRADLDQVLATGPDFISLNEVSRRTDAQITPAGYGMWRHPAHGLDGTAVLWRTDSWTKVASGRVMMVDHGPQKWDRDRAATWVTVRGVAGNQVSVISVHHMVNPAKYGPNKPLRQRLYRQGLEKVQDLVEDLSADGPVFLAGDLNYQYSGGAPWGPRAMLGDVGMKSSMDVLGAEPTHDSGGIIDYLFFQPVEATPTQQATERLNSDHRLLRATFALTTPASRALPAGATQPFGSLTATQTENAGHVFAVGRQLGIPEEGIVIALAVASQESGFRVYANDGKGGDLAADQRGIEASLQLPHDAVGSDQGSLGIMQQQWPWWSPLMEQLMDPPTSARLFYDALRKVEGWESMSLTEAAQAVQRSAYPGAYADDEVLAQSLYDHFAGGGAAGTTDTVDIDFEEPLAQISLTAEEQAECEELLGLPSSLSCPPTGLSVERAAVSRSPLQGAGFTVASVNVLGASHTASGRRARMGSGPARMQRTIAWVRDNQLDVIGLQEFQPSQRRVFQTRARDYALFPAGRASRRAAANSIAWRDAAFELVDGRYVSIPYFHGKPFPMPVVTLRNKTTGQEVVVMNVHNPADAHGPAGHWRNQAERIERRTVADLAAGTGPPVILTGDFNAPLAAIDVGLEPVVGAVVDWIFATSGFTVTERRVDKSVKGRWTDHPAVIARVGGSDSTAGGPATTNDHGLTPDALLVLRCVDQQFGRHIYLGVGDRAANPESDHPSGRAVDVMIDHWLESAGANEGTEIAEWVRAHHSELGVKYVIWRAEIWSADRAGEGWRPYSHPSGATDPTSLHMDHVHVSVYGNRGTGFPAAAGGTVVYPVPATMADANQDNWGESGENWDRWHTGTDFSVPCGTPVLAAHSGTVQIDRSQSWAGPQLVKISLGPGHLTTWYAHMQTVIVSGGDVVAAGQRIGEVGSEGNSSGCHLHFEVHLKGGRIYGPDNTDPTGWLARHVGRTLPGGPRIAVPVVDPGPPVGDGTSLILGSWNVLGHHHTPPGNRRGYAGSAPRMRWAVTALNRAGVQVAGFQEFQPENEAAFRAATRGRWATWPHSGGRRNAYNVVAWRTARWQQLVGRRIAIPFLSGHRNVPYVLLAHRVTGHRVWVVSAHNPANVRGPAEADRRRAVALENALVRRLHGTGYPVLVTGDMNDRADYYCQAVAGTPLHAANGGSTRPGPCRPPRRVNVDWIMGTPQVRFSGFQIHRGVVGRISDHPLLTTTITLPDPT